MTILITGATGNVGRPLVSQLLSAGHDVRALPATPRAELPTGVDVVAGNLDDTDSLRTAFDADQPARGRFHRSPDRRERHWPGGEDVCPVGEGERGRVRAMSTLRLE